MNFRSGPQVLELRRESTEMWRLGVFLAAVGGAAAMLGVIRSVNAFVGAGLLFFFGGLLLALTAETTTFRLSRDAACAITYTRRFTGRTRVRRLPHWAIVGVEHVARDGDGGRSDTIYLALSTGELLEVAEHRASWRRRRDDCSPADRAREQARRISACMRVPIRYVDMLTIRSALRNLRTQRDRMKVLKRPSQAELDEEFRRMCVMPPRST